MLQLPGNRLGYGAFMRALLVTLFEWVELRLRDHSVEPPIESTAYPVFVQPTDADGNALGGIRGGINWSSQHNREEGCDGRETAVGSSVTGQVEVARAAGDRAT